MTHVAASNMVDPFTVEVIRHALTAAAEEMSFVVMRSARSPLLREAGDLRRSRARPGHALRRRHDRRERRGGVPRATVG